MMSSLPWPVRPACFGKVAGWNLCPLLLLLLAGCTADTSPKTSHFEHDHFVAPHRPRSLADAATKIRDRLAWLEEGRTPVLHVHSHQHGHSHDHDHGHHYTSDPRAEIVEIVSWIPEIAADTNLTEADWLPLYHATESLSANLRRADGELTDSNRDQLDSLCELVDDAATKIPEQLPSLAQGHS